MSVFASSNRFPIDALLILRPSGEAAMTASAASDSYYTVDVLTSYWASGDEASDLDFVAVFTVEAAPVGTGTYVLSIQASTSTGFGSPVTVGSVTVSAAGEYVVSINREELIAAFGSGNTTGYLRAYATIGGTSPSIQWNVYLSPLTGE